MKVNILDVSGANQEIDLDVTVYRDAADAQMTVPQYVNQKYQTNAEKDGTAFEQIMASTGLFLHKNDHYGIRPPTMQQVLNGNVTMNAGVIVRDASPASRIVFPAVFLEAVENKLKDDTVSYVGTFNGMVAIDDSII